MAIAANNNTHLARLHGMECIADSCCMALTLSCCGNTGRFSKNALAARNRAKSFSTILETVLLSLPFSLSPANPQKNLADMRRFIAIGNTSGKA